MTTTAKSTTDLSMRTPIALALLAGALLAAALPLAGCSSPARSARYADAASQPGVYDTDRIESKRARVERAGPKRMDQPQEARDYFLAQRLPAHMDAYPIALVQREADRYRERQALAPRGGDALAGAWAEVGPGNIGGRTRAIVVDPTNPQIIYAAGVAGGVFKTIDGGASWTPTTDSLVNLAVSSLVMDPVDPLTLYAGTGEGFFNGDAVRGLGIFKTSDGGATWQQLPGTVAPQAPAAAFHYVNKIVISPSDRNRLYAATRFGVWRSTNGGITWEIRLANQVYGTGPNLAGFTPGGALDLESRPGTIVGQPDVLFATFGSFSPDGLYRSTDSGVTWSRVNDADLDRPDQGRMTIDISPSNPDIMYICMAANGQGATEAGRVIDVYRSTNGGTSWEPRLNPTNFLSDLLLTNIPFASGCFDNRFLSQGWYDNIIKIDPVDPDIVWVGGIDLLRSDDGGRNFGIASYWYFNVDSPNYSHADQHEIIFHPQYDGVTNQTMWVGSDGGVSRTDNARAPVTSTDCPDGSNPLADVAFVQLNNGYGVTQFYHGQISQASDTFVGGTQDNGTLLAAARDTLNGWSRIFGGDGGYVAIDPRTDLRLYVETQTFGTIRRSEDGGLSFVGASNGLSDNGLFITPFAMDPINPDRLWTGGTAIWRTDNRGENWTQRGPNLFGPGRVSAIAVAPTDSNRVYMGYEDGYVAVSRNATSANPTWTFNSSGLPTEAGFISSVAVDPNNADLVYATCATFDLPKLYRSTDGGVNWVVIDGAGADALPPVPAHSVAIRPGNSDELFVGTEVGVFESADGGVTWRPAGQGLPATVCETIDFKDENTMVVFTHGRGTFINTFDGFTGPCTQADLAEPFGTLDLADIVIFLQGFNTGQPVSDFTGDGIFDLADIVAFVSSFGAGCP